MYLVFIMYEETVEVNVNLILQMKTVRLREDK